MKKTLAFLLTAIAVVSLYACGSKEIGEIFGASSKNETVEKVDTVGKAATDTKAATSATTEAVTTTTVEAQTTTKAPDITTSVTPPSIDNTAWKQFLKDYEAWVDSYIAIVSKYKANPTDVSIFSDYSKMISEMSDWSESADELDAQLQDTAAYLEYSSELIRIAGKIAEAAY